MDMWLGISSPPVHAFMQDPRSSCAHFNVGCSVLMSMLSCIVSEFSYTCSYVGFPGCTVQTSWHSSRVLLYKLFSWFPGPSVLAYVQGFWVLLCSLSCRVLKSFLYRGILDRNRICMAPRLQSRKWRKVCMYFNLIQRLYWPIQTDFFKTLYFTLSRRRTEHKIFSSSVCSLIICKHYYSPNVFASNYKFVILP